jgi:hypothetical protein
MIGKGRVNSVTGAKCCTTGGELCAGQQAPRRENLAERLGSFDVTPNKRQNRDRRHHPHSNENAIDRTKEHHLLMCGWARISAIHIADGRVAREC